ncbi:BON domain-containing protein, partial [Streptococcus pneumoniae]|uniref:BON domain-containing protein n=1 Tax=Streptococcus pneumoniae TaxID=1313 RepID=UPI0013DB4432
ISFAEAPVTADIAKRVSGQLAGQGFDWAKVETVGRDVRLTGQAPSPEAQARAVTAAGQVAGSRLVDNATGIIALQRPYLWSAEKTAGAITLT